ncbi:MAG: 5-formyltetrahydrofolate cyclo-ligase [Desulfovibrionaceae bacterium]|nr:5-formyltetrahydrofolate cyclo-ligase [Desulfovibrionaceae bacterium]
MRKKRKDLAEKERFASSKQIQKYVLNFDIYISSQSLTMYLPLPEEVDTTDLVDESLKQGKTVYLPRVLPKSQGRMEFVPVTKETLFRKSPFGILEPDPKYQGFSANEFDSNFQPDLIILPGIAFDRYGQRLGFGGGFYDRFLQTYPKSIRLGLCFSQQLIDFLPHDPWDQKVNYLCTEEGVLCL